MSIDKFLNQSSCAWMSADGPQSDIVLTSRIRLARNLKDYLYPTMFSAKDAQEIVNKVEGGHFQTFRRFPLKGSGNDPDEYAGSITKTSPR